MRGGAHTKEELHTLKPSECFTIQFRYNKSTKYENRSLGGVHSHVVTKGHAHSPQQRIPYNFSHKH